MLLFDLPASGKPEDDPRRKADQQILIVDLDPLLPARRLAQAVATIITNMRLALPVLNSLPLAEFVTCRCRALGLMAVRAGPLGLRTVRGCTVSGLARLVWLIMVLAGAWPVMTALSLCHRNCKHRKCDRCKDDTLEHCLSSLLMRGP